jgi:hypothetical protein
VLASSVAQHAARTRTRTRALDLRLVNVPPLIARQLRQHNFDELMAESPPGER